MNIRQQKYHLKKLVNDLSKKNDRSKLTLIEMILTNNIELQTYYEHITKPLNMKVNKVALNCQNNRFKPRYINGIYEVICTVCGGKYEEHK